MNLRPFSIALVLSAGLLAGCLQPGAQATRQTLPKIRVAKDGRSFVTAKGKPFVPMGVTYYRPGTGWAPQVWKQFDLEATRQDFARMKELGINCVRVFISYGSFYSTPGRLEPEGLAKFDQFLSVAEAAGVYVHPTGPDHWEGPPRWPQSAVEDEEQVQALETFWREFAARYRGRNVIFAYDLRNEPAVGWDSLSLQTRWHGWLKRTYVTGDRLAKAWRTNTAPDIDSIPIPPPKDALLDPALLDFQRCREEAADDWTRRQAAAIKSSDPEALVTVGFIQWSVPALLPGNVRHYAAFRPDRQAKYLDFLEIHFYPLARGAYEYRSEADEVANLAYLESVVREVARPGKPVLLAEFGWYGGGKPRFDGGVHPASTQEQHARYCRRAVETSAGWVVGWLNWGFYDQPEATDCSQFTGLATPDGQIKDWGRAFQRLAQQFQGKAIAPKPCDAPPTLNWDACITSTAAGAQFTRDYLNRSTLNRRTD